MGGCHCVADENNDNQAVTLEPAEDMRLRKLAFAQVQTATSMSISFECPGIELQHAVRAYLVRKGLDQVDFPESNSVAPQVYTDVQIDPVTLLSDKALTTLKRLPALQLARQVVGAVPQGPRSLKEGGVFVGEWSLHLQVSRGRGQFYGSDGSYSEGYWNAGELHLFGRAIYGNGDYYEGDFSQGQRTGSGKFETYDGLCVYEGEWRDDMRWGTGKERYADGSCYEGEFANDIKSGRGSIRWSDGSSYEGDFLREQLTGKGTYRWADNRVYSGDWVQGQMHGQGRFTYADGKTYVGGYLNDRKNGYGVFTWPDYQYAGEWLDGHMHGFGEVINKQGVKKRYEFRNGVRLREIPL
jgi:hypothetical protein